MVHTSDGSALNPSRPSSQAVGILYGIGLGGFVDGIVLHQILQWHHLVSHTDSHPVSTVAGLEANTLADGLFHVVAWLFVVLATAVTIVQWRRDRRAPSWTWHVGGVLIGWGIFNVVEGLVNHQILGIHHVRDDLGGPASWDIGFLAFGVLLVVVGRLVQMRGRTHLRRSAPPAPSSR